MLQQPRQQGVARLHPPDRARCALDLLQHRLRHDLRDPRRQPVRYGDAGHPQPAHPAAGQEGLKLKAGETPWTDNWTVESVAHELEYQYEAPPRPAEDDDEGDTTPAPDEQVTPAPGTPTPGGSGGGTTGGDTTGGDTTGGDTTGGGTTGGDTEEPGPVPVPGGDDGAEDPPAEEPPAEEPPAENPPANDPPASDGGAADGGEG